MTKENPARLAQLKRNVREAAEEVIHARRQQSNAYRFAGGRFRPFQFTAQNETDYLEKYVNAANSDIYHTPMPIEGFTAPLGTDMGKPVAKLEAARQEYQAELAKQTGSSPRYYPKRQVANAGRSLGATALLGLAGLAILAFVPGGQIIGFAILGAAVIGGGCYGRLCVSWRLWLYSKWYKHYAR